MNTHSDLIPDKTLLYCWNILETLITGQIILVSDHAPKNPDLFVKCAMQYITSTGKGQFSFDYKKFKQTLSFKEQNKIYEKLNLDR